MKHRTPLATCPSCGHQLDAATSMTGHDAIKPDDITICLYCGHVMAFGNDLEFRPLTDAEMKLVAGDKRILAIQRARGAFVK
jgi:hypothetical protein